MMHGTTNIKYILLCYISMKKKVICCNTFYILFHRLGNMFRIEVNPSSGYYTISYTVLSLHSICGIPHHNYHQKVTIMKTVIWDPTNIIQWKYCMATCHYIIPAICFVWWPDFNLKQAAKPMKENISCVLTDDLPFFHSCRNYISKY